MKLTFHQYLQGQSFHIEQTHLTMPYSYAGEKCCYAPRVCNGKYVFTYGCIFLFILLTPMIFSFTNQTKTCILTARFDAQTRKLYPMVRDQSNFLAPVQINIPSRQVLLKPGTYILSVYKKLVYRSLLKLVK